MTRSDWRFHPWFGKSFLCAALAAVCLGAAGCSVNPATGKSQFTALMSEDDERSIGAQEHPKIMASFGGAFENRALEQKVRAIGERLSAAAFKERAGVVCCQFYVIDTPMINAFATPGGYVYVSRGLLALANTESEIAAVVAHEIAHIAARHAAERYSHGAVSSLAAAVVAAAANAPGLADTAAGIGSELYIRSYSRAQESESDALGLEYLVAAGYDPRAMAAMLGHIERFTAFEQSGGESLFNYFSTHPRTSDRIADVRARVAKYPGRSTYPQDRDGWLSAIDGLVWGDSPAQGMVRGRDFIHVPGDFAFTAPEGAKIVNRPEEVAIVGPGGAVAIFDAVAEGTGASPADYLTGQWVRRERVENLQNIVVAGRPAATASFTGTVDGRPVTIRLVAVSWAPGRLYRFQIALPQGASDATVDGMRRMTYSLRPLTAHDRAKAAPQRIAIVTAGPGESVDSLAGRMRAVERPVETLRVLNALDSAQGVVTGARYKIVVPGR